MRGSNPVRETHAWSSNVILILVLVSALAPLAEAHSPPPPRTVWTVYNTVEAIVNDNYAVVSVMADIGNRGPDPEFPFVVEIPADAFITGLTIVRDGEVFEATIEERGAAREKYEEWKAQEQTGGLVEKRRGSSVYSYLINVAEFTSVRATLTYVRYLPAEEGVYNLHLQAPVSGFGQDLGARFDVTILHSDGLVDAWGTPAANVERLSEGVRLTFSVGSRANDSATAFTASYVASPTRDGGSLTAVVVDGKGYFAHRFLVPTEAPQLPLDLVLVLDTSGSMAGLKMQQMQDASTQVLGLLDADDRLHVAFFSSSTNSLWRGLKDAETETITDAVAEISRTLAAGGTNIQSGISTGLNAFAGVNWSAEEGRMPILVFLTDGQATVGESRGEMLRQQAIAANDNGVAVFAIAFGSDADWSLIHGLAADGKGAALRVPEGAGAEVDLRRFIAALTTPVLKDVVITYGPGVEAFHRSAPILFAGSELLIVGTFDAELDSIEGVVAGRAPDGARRYEFGESVADAKGVPFLPALVAYHEIAHFQERISAEGERQDWVERVTSMALEHHMVTDYTSLVVTLPERASRPEMRWTEEDSRWSGASQGGLASMDSSPSTFSPLGPESRRTQSPSSPETGPSTPDEGGARPAAVPGIELALVIVAIALVASRLRRLR